MSEDDEPGAIAAASRQEAIINTMNMAEGATGATGAAGAEDELPPLCELLDDTENFRAFTNESGKKRVQCLCCKKDFSYVSKVLSHVNLVKNQGVSLCTGDIPENYRRRYLELYERKVGSKNKKNGECVYFLCVLIIINAFPHPTHIHCNLFNCY